MADGGEAINSRTIGSLRSIRAEAWNALASPPDAPFNPFVSHEFLLALEESGSVGNETGWTPAHLSLEAFGAPIGVAPLYIKAHSLGEYVFDHHWAEAFERAGGRYFPKLVCAAPFSPAPGPRLLAPGAADRRRLADALVEAAHRSGASSIHVNFIGANDETALLDAGFIARRGVQYHWFNRGYATYDDFLALLASRKRKQIKRERREAVAGGVEIRRLRGTEISEIHWDAFWSFYQNTGARKWGRPYLTRAFFHRLAATMSDRLVMFVAERDGDPVAGALNFIGGDAIYGRYWGCTEHHAFLHFELCYHQAIEFAIEEGIARVEAGAQGEHKIARGYEPVETRSAHWIADPSFRRAIDRYLADEREQIAMHIAALALETPFKRNGAQ